MLLLPVFDTVICPPELFVMVPPELKMPTLSPEFDTVIVPELVRVPELVMPMLLVFDMTSVVPDGITSSSVAAITLPELLIVHVLVGPSHVPPYVGHEVASSVMVAAFASWLNDSNPKTKTEAITRIDIILITHVLFLFSVLELFKRIFFKGS